MFSFGIISKLLVCILMLPVSVIFAADTIDSCTVENIAAFGGEILDINEDTFVAWREESDYSLTVLCKDMQEYQGIEKEQHRCVKGMGIISGGLAGIAFVSAWGAIGGDGGMTLSHEEQTVYISVSLSSLALAAINMIPWTRAYRAKIRKKNLVAKRFEVAFKKPRSNIR